MALNSHVYAEIIGFEGTFDSVQGGELQSNIVDHYPGGSRTPEKLQGTYTYSDIVLTREWKPLQDRPVLEWAKRSVVDGIYDPKTLVKYTRNEQGIIIDKKSYQVKPRGTKTPDGKSGDDGIAEFMITLAVIREL